MAVLYPGAGTLPSSTLYPSENADPVPVDPTAGLVSLEQARAFVGATAEDDALLQFIIGAASDKLEREYGPLRGTVTQTFHSAVGGPIILPIGATVVGVQVGSVAQTGYRHDVRSGLLHDVYGYGSATVTYTVPLTERTQLAALYTIKHAWSMRPGAQPTSFGVPGEGADTALRTFFIPAIARELLHDGPHVA